jgi:hypothetical protein
MSRYAYVVSNPLGPVGVFLSRKGAKRFVAEHTEIMRVDRLIRDDPYHLHTPFTREQFLKNESYHGKDKIALKHHLPFKEEAYGFD